MIAGLHIIVAFSNSARIEKGSDGLLYVSAHDWLPYDDHVRLEALGFLYDTKEHAYLIPGQSAPDKDL